MTESFAFLLGFKKGSQRDGNQLALRSTPGDRQLGTSRPDGDGRNNHPGDLPGSVCSRASSIHSADLFASTGH
jgi:hypothetical protein